MNSLLKSALIVLVVIATALLSYWLGRSQAPLPASLSPSPSASPLAEVDWVKVRWRDWQQQVNATGNLTANPDLQSQVGAPAPGRITQMFGNVGDRVHQGQVLALLRSPEITRVQADYHHARVRLELAEKTLAQRQLLARLGDASRRPVEEARNEYASAKAERDIADSARQVARQKLARTKDLLVHGIATQQQLEEDKAALDEREARYRQALGQLAVAQEHRDREERVARQQLLVQPKILEAQTEVSLAREEVSHASKVLENFGLVPGDNDVAPLRAPTSGILVARKASLGQWVSAEQELFQILNPAAMWLWLTLYEKDFGSVKMGMTVDLVDLKLQGRIGYLSPVLESGSRTQRVRVEVSNPGSLRVGMFTRARILTGPLHRSLSVPNAAVQGQRFVFRKTAGGIEKVEIKPGLEDRQSGEIEVLSGLHEGDEVVTEGSYLLYQRENGSD